MNTCLSLAYSTCPNDTFIFYALAHKIVGCGSLSFAVELADIETLNQKAKAGKFDISKLSFAALGHLQDTYGLLRSGAALGRGCGPLIVARPESDLNQLSDHEKTKTRIAVPGMWTTAYMLLSLYLSSKPEVIPMPFEQIMPAVANGDADFGVIIHEGRFTYKTYGLICLLDLGEWWENKTSLPIPLGGIAIRRSLLPETAEKVETAIKDSITYAFENKGAADDYIKKHAQEMSPAVIRQHIELYVNEFSLNLGKEGETAIDTLFSMARRYGILPESNVPLFR